MYKIEQRPIQPPLLQSDKSCIAEGQRNANALFPQRGDVRVFAKLDFRPTIAIFRGARSPPPFIEYFP
jgi:hypothetical protein